MSGNPAADVEAPKGKKKQPTRVESEQMRQRVREELLKGYRPLEVKDRLKISKSAVYRHINGIYKEDANWIEDFGTKGLMVTAYRSSLDSLQRHKRNMMKISENPEEKSIFRVMAGKEVRETETSIVQLQIEGPTIWSLKRKAQQKPTEPTISTVPNA